MLGFGAIVKPFLDFTLADLPPLDLPDPASIFRESMLVALKGCIDKEVEDLTELERFAIAYAAGVPLASAMGEDGKLKFTTARCGIYKYQGKFHVAIEAPDKTPRVKFR